MGTPVAYLRKSRVFDDRIGVSWEVQEAKVRELAAQHGDNGARLVILSDWNASGRKGPKARPGYRRLIEMIGAGQVGAIYSYNMARLSRSTRDLLELVQLADERHVPIRLVADHVDTSTATGRMLLTVLAAVDQMTADLASEHAKDAVAARRARGDRIGHPFYGEQPGEDADAVVKAYEHAGSVLGAARVLNARRVPTRMGKPWSSTSVRDTLIRLGAMPHRTRPGAKARAPFVLYGLLRCHCGHTLTGNRYRNGKDPTYTAYKCYLSRTVPDHGLSAVPEKRIMAWVMAEAARLCPPEAVQMDIERHGERDRLAARRARILDMYEAGNVGREEYQRRLTAVKVDEERLDAQEAATAVLAVPKAIDWSWPAEQINAVLRAMWEHVQLDETMRPVGAGWLVPDWRRGPSDVEESNAGGHRRQVPAT